MEGETWGDKDVDIKIMLTLCGPVTSLLAFGF
jgi:hypothetical protein